MRTLSPRAPIVLVAIVASVLAAPLLAAPFTTAEWYVTLSRPSWAPPPEAFGPVWTALYAMMIAAAIMIARADVPAAPRWRALGAFFVQMALNVAWTPLFFGLRSPAAGLVTILALDVALAVTLLLFMRVRRAAALLLVPYFVWSLFATALNAAILAWN